MKVYIAASYSGHERILQYADELRKLGINVLSLWFDDEFFVEKAWDGDFGGKVAQTMATLDSHQILESDLVILDTIEKSSTGGSDTELGIVIGLQLAGRRNDIVHIGPYRNIFQTMVRKHFDNWESALEWLKVQVAR